MYAESLIRHIFPGGNTSLGFYSFYDYIADDSFQRIYILKGGPGVGKSTYMRHIGEYFLNRGFPVEFHHCSSDQNSLDAVVIPHLKVALMDGTAPHQREPKYPAVLEVVLDFSRFWDENKIRVHREKIMALKKQISAAFASAYRYLQAAALLKQEQDTVYTTFVDQGKLVASKCELGEEIFQDHTPGRGKVRHFFGGGITPQGCVNYLSSIVGTARRLYVITGPPGTGQEEILNHIVDLAALYQLDHEVYHCALEPKKLEHVLIPALDTAVVTSHPPHVFEPEHGHRIDTTHFLQRPLDDHEVQAAQESKEAYQSMLQLAIQRIQGAKQNHSTLEGYYAPHMDFAQLDRFREEILREILALPAT